MKRLLPIIFVALTAATGWAAPAPAPTGQLDRANVIPLALSDDFQIEKAQLFLNAPATFKPTASAMINFERNRVTFGAIDGLDRKAREGNYFTFFWKTSTRGDVTFRLEYRTENLGPYVQAREVHYENVKGGMKTRFAVIGDDYLQDGRVNAWRALLIRDGKIVGLKQSFLWN